MFHIFIVFHCFSFFEYCSLSFDKAQKYESGQGRIVSRPWRDMAPNYIFGSLPLRGKFSVCFIVFVACFILFSLVFIVFIVFHSRERLSAGFFH